MKKFSKTEMTTLVKCSNNLYSEGYKENFVAKEGGIHAGTNDTLYKPEEVKIVSFYRFEGESDPGDSSVLYAIEAHDGKKGMLIDAYGAYANPLVSKFIARVEEITKKGHFNEPVA